MKNKFLVIPVVVILFGLMLPGRSVAQMDKVLNLPTYDFSKYHFGFILAGNEMSFSLKTKEGFTDVWYYDSDAPGLSYDSLRILSITGEPTPGFTIGIVANLRLGKYFDLRFIPSLAFGERKLNYSLFAYRDTVPSILEISKPITSTYVEFPLHVKYKSARLNNVRGYVIAGVKYNLDLASNKKNKEEDDEGNPVFLKLKRHDLLFEVGVGFDFYTAFFKFGTELKMGWGINDLLEREDNIFTNGIERLNSKIFTLSLTFE
ncbi:MAG: PorT family protein [Bacteroidales bacterium]|nr:PorT family protein [Bacteroidales bacterium]MCF8399216.1 PorT family protein [Bacteroidales bacterium]